jgi:hypothetical protein
MRSFWADPAGFSFSQRMYPVLTNFADEVCATLARLMAYLMILALLAVLGLSGWDQLPRNEASEPTAPASWALADRSYPAFAVSRIDTSDKSEAYEILRHPEGGRKDTLRWTGQAGNPTAELEIYRLGGEAEAAANPRADLAARMTTYGASDIEAAGVIDSKFGLGSPDRRLRRRGVLPRLPQANRRSFPADFGLVMRGRQHARPARRRRLPAEPPDPARLRKRSETGGVFRSGRTPARHLRRLGRISAIGRLGDPYREPAAAQRVLTAQPPRNAPPACEPTCCFSCAFAKYGALCPPVWRI